jgi:putative transposase
LLNLEKNKKVQSVWHLDETYVNEEWRYLYRATDGDGHTLDIQLRRTRDHQATYMFMKRLVKDCGEPTVLITANAPALLCVQKVMLRIFFTNIRSIVP